MCWLSGRLGVGVSLGVTYGLLGAALVGWRVESEDFLQACSCKLGVGGGSLKGDSKGVIR